MLSVKKLKYLIKDEKKSAKFYSKHGLPELAEDERKHRRILMRKLKRRLRTWVWWIPLEIWLLWALLTKWQATC